MTATDNDREVQRIARKMASSGQCFRRQIDRLCATAQELGTKPAERVNQETAHADP